MKFIVLAVLLCASGTFAHHKKMHHHFHEDFFNTCMAELNITKCEKGYPNKNDTNFNCIPRCIMLKKGQISENGKPIAEKFAPEIAANLTTCYNKAKSERECIREKQLGRCIRNATMALHKKMSLACQIETNTTLPKKHWRKWNKTEGTETNGTRGKHHIGGHECLWKNKTFACYNRCMLLKQGMINENNEIVSKKLESIVDKMNKNNKVDIKIDQVVKNCTDSTKQDDKCLEVMQRAKCIWEHIACKGAQFKEGAIADTTDDNIDSDSDYNGEHDNNESDDESENGSDDESENSTDEESENSSDDDSENSSDDDTENNSNDASENNDNGNDELLDQAE